MISVNLEGPALQIMTPYFQRKDDGSKLKVVKGVVVLI